MYIPRCDGLLRLSLKEKKRRRREEKDKMRKVHDLAIFDSQGRFVWELALTGPSVFMR